MKLALFKVLEVHREREEEKSPLGVHYVSPNLHTCYFSLYKCCLESAAHYNTFELGNIFLHSQRFIE